MSLISFQERKKELVDHREDSTFSFDPANINVRKLTKSKIKKIDARKGVLLSSYTRKKTRRRKRGRSQQGPIMSPSNNVPKQSEESSATEGPKSPKPIRSVTPSPSPSSRNSRGSPRPQVLPLPLPPPKHVQLSEPKSADMLHPSNALGKFLFISNIKLI